MVRLKLPAILKVVLLAGLLAATLLPAAELFESWTSESLDGEFIQLSGLILLTCGLLLFGRISLPPILGGAPNRDLSRMPAATLPLALLDTRHLRVLRI
jgi:hypothetical protein